MLSETNQIKKRELPHDFIHMCNIKTKSSKINEQTKPNKNKHIDTENRVGVITGEGWQWGK